MLAQLPDERSRLRYAIDGATMHLPRAMLDGVSGFLDRGGRALLAEVLRVFAAGPGMSAEAFGATFGGGRLGDASLAALRGAANAAGAATTIGELGQASALLGQSLSGIGPDALPQAIGELRRRVTELFERNVDRLAGVLDKEAGSIEHRIAMEAIGLTFLNRMRRNGTVRVEDIRGYGTPGAPSDFAIGMARRLLDGSSADMTQGATHFYTPQGMPKETDAPAALVGHDIGGGLESVSGVVKGGKDRWVRNYRPAFAKAFPPVEVPGVPPAIAKFHRAPGIGHVR